MAAASLHGPHRRLHRKALQIARVDNPRGSRHSLAGWQRALRDQAPEDCGTDTQRHRSLLEGQPVVLLWDSWGGDTDTARTRHCAPARFSRSRYESPSDAAWPRWSGRDRPWRVHGSPPAPAAGVARPCFPTVCRATRNSVCTPPCQWSCNRCAGGSGSVSMSIACSTVRSRRFLSAAEAAGCSHTAPRSWPNVSNRWRCSSLSVLRRLASVARWRFHLRDMDEGVMPAPFSCPRHQTVVRINPLIVPSGPLDLVTRLLQGSCSGLPWRVMRHLDTIERAGTPPGPPRAGGPPAPPPSRPDPHAGRRSSSRTRSPGQPGLPGTHPVARALWCR